jgi:glycosyltransferase involved in cell wall biosynthesis
MTTPIRILFVSHDSSLYGAQLSLLGLLESLDRNRFYPLVVVPYEGQMTEALCALNIPFHILPIVHWIASEKTKNTWIHRVRTFTPGLRGRVWTFAHLIERNNIDIVYTNTVTCLEGALAAKITGRPHVWHLREQVKGNSQLSSIVPAFLIPWIVHILSWRALVNSRHVYRAYYNYPFRRKLGVVYNGVDPVKFDIDRTEASCSLRTELDLPLNYKIVVIIGSIIPRKGLLLFVDAAYRLISSMPDVTFLVVGEGPSDYKQLVQNRVQEYGLNKSFRFVSWRRDIPRVLAGVDLLVIAAEEEPFGRTVIEAMAAGVPVVSTRCGGPEEIILNEISGLLIPSRNSSEMAVAIKRILSDPEFATNLVKAGKDRLNQKFTLQAYTDNVQSELEAVIQCHHAARRVNGA